MRFQQSAFNHHYKSIERGATSEETNKIYVVKADSVPSSESESEASNSKSIVESVKDFMAVLYQFIYPYALYGRVSTNFSITLMINIPKLLSILFFFSFLLNSDLDIVLN